MFLKLLITQTQNLIFITILRNDVLHFETHICLIKTDFYDGHECLIKKIDVLNMNRV